MLILTDIMIAIVILLQVAVIMLPTNVFGLIHLTVRSTRTTSTGGSLHHSFTTGSRYKPSSNINNDAVTRIGKSTKSVTTIHKRISFFHTTTKLLLNRFLFDISEISNNTSTTDTATEHNNNTTNTTTNNNTNSIIVVVLNKDDYRTIHAAKILQLQNNNTIRCGIVSCTQYQYGLLCNDATIQWLPEGKIKKAMPLNNGNPPGSLQITFHTIYTPQQHQQQVPVPVQVLPTVDSQKSTSSILLQQQQQNQQSTTLSSSSSSLSLSTSSVSIILALPRPIQLSRILPMISQMGIETIILTNANKVPKDYFGSQLLKTPQLITNKLIEGLCQCGDVTLPNVYIIKNLYNFLNTTTSNSNNCNDATITIDTIFPINDYARVIAHPQRPIVIPNTDGTETIIPLKRMKDVQFPLVVSSSSSCSDSNILVNDNDTKEKYQQKQQQQPTPKKIVIAIGPEGGWDEPNEIQMFVQKQFQPITLGSRVLRSDCAVISLLALANDICM